MASIALAAPGLRISPRIHTGRAKSAAFSVRASSGGGCCGGSGSGSSSGSSCSSHSKITMPDLDYNPGGAGGGKSGVENVGKEFEALVAQQTLMEMEKDYETTQMRGTISKEVVKEAMNSVPDTTSNEHGNSCVDIDQLLSEAADCNFVFQQGDEEIVLV